jgi:hypothetical protein
MDAFIFIGLMSLCIALWLVRINRWPKVQARVLKKWEEITGRDIDNFAVGWQHAEVEYWYESKNTLRIGEVIFKSKTSFNLRYGW